MGHDDDEEGFSRQEWETILTLLLALSLIGMLFSASVLYSYFRFHLLKTKSGLLILCLVCTDIGSAIGDVMAAGTRNGFETGSAACTLQGMWSQFFDIASVMWVTVLALVVHMNIIQQKNFTDWHLKRCHLCVWGIALIFSLLPLSTNQYGRAGAWCWISASGNANQVASGTAWRMCIFYVPLWIAILLTGYIYWKVDRTIRTYTAFARKDDLRLRQLKDFADRLKYFPAIMIAAWSLATILRIYNWVYPNDYDYKLTMVQCTIGNGSFVQAVGNAIIYGLTPSVRHQWEEMVLQVKDEKSCRTVCECLFLAPEQFMRDSFDQNKLHDDMQAEQSPEVAQDTAELTTMGHMSSSEDDSKNLVGSSSADKPTTEMQLQAAV